MRTILLDQASRNIGLVFHNDSIIKQIYSTSSFKDEDGFNRDLYEEVTNHINEQLINW